MKQKGIKNEPEIDAFLLKNPIVDKDKKIIKEMQAAKNVSKKSKKKSQVSQKNDEYRNIPKLDLHGKTEWQAEEAFKDFFGKYINKTQRVLVVHGKGVNSDKFFGPVLKNMVWRMLTVEFKNHIEKWYHPEEKFGGEGATIIEFKSD